MIDHKHPEPVPYASQFAVLPFVAGVEGYIKQQSDMSFRLTMHRITTWESQGHFQQVCTYFGSEPKDQSKVGRMLAVTTGIIGKAFKEKKIARTKKYSTAADLMADLRLDMTENNEPGTPEKIPPSYLAIPFIGAQNEVVLVLYADSAKFNFFADDKIVTAICAMCHGFTELFDWLQESDALPTIQNFPLAKGTPLKREPTAYRRLQEVLDIPVPKFKAITAFNYEVTVS